MLSLSADLYKYQNNDEYVRRNLASFLLMQLYSPVVIKQMAVFGASLDDFFIQNTPPKMWDLAQKSPLMKDEDIQTEINRFWTKKAINVLSGYQNCSFPITDDLRIDVRKENFLSDKGEKLLQELLISDVSRHYTDKAFFAGNKIFLDLDLFRDFSYLKKIDPIIRVGSYDPYWPEGSSFPLILSASSGCYNRCMHCLYEAEPKVRHMPYPVFLKMYHTLGDGESLLTYADSDPISYYDPIIDADAGDLFIGIKSRGWQMPRDFITKGILKERDKSALLKIALIRYQIGLSLVGIDGEVTEKNLKRVRESYRILSKTKVGAHVRYYHEKDGHCIDMEKWLAEIPNYSDIVVLPVGRGRFLKNTSSRPFDAKDFVVDACGDLFDVYYKENRFVWQKMGSLLNPNDVQKIKEVPIRHPSRDYQGCLIGKWNFSHFLINDHQKS